MKYFTSVLLILISVMVFSSGCAKLMGNLRRDLDDREADSGPTTGGRWTEAGYLSEDMSGPNEERSLGPNGRSPASDMSRNDSNGSWLAPRTNESARQANDQEVAFSNTPSVAPPMKRLYKNGNRATKADFIDEGNNEGSLWASDGQTNYYFTKNKIRGVGDIVSLTVEADLLKDISAEIGRTLSTTEKEHELELAQLMLDSGVTPGADPKKDQIATSAAAATGLPPPDAPKKDDKKPGQKREATWTDVDLSKAIEMKSGDVIMAEIVERYPNGNYKLRGSKKIRYRNGFRYVNILGIVKGTDISEADSIASGKLYEYRLEAVR